jgi:phytoene dehydrogenase-like protein
MMRPIIITLAHILCLITYCYSPAAAAFATSRIRRSTYLRAGDVHKIDDDKRVRVEEEEEVVDVAIIGAGIGGLCAGAILNTLFNKKVGIYESHYLPGGCAHAFQRRATNGVSFTFDSGPTIVLGCSKEPYNPLQQVLRAVGVDSLVQWIPYDGWGMIEHPNHPTLEKRWKLNVGPNYFEDGPLYTFATNNTAALDEFNALRDITRPLVVGAATIPALAMRPGPTSLIPLLRYLPSLFSILRNGVDVSTGPFAPFMNGPIFKVKDKWLRNWLDALAFSLSGLPAERTSAAALAYVLYDMHREGAALDYPKGGLGEVINALVIGVEQRSRRGINLGSKVHLRRHVESIEFNDVGNRAIGLTVRKGGGGGGTVFVKARDGVICNAPIWSLRKLIRNEGALRLLDGGNIIRDEQDITPQREPKQSWVTTANDDNHIGRRSVIRPRHQKNDDSDKATNNLLTKCDTAEMTGSFLHLHLALDSNGLDIDKLEPHYTVMDRGLEGDSNSIIEGVIDGPCGEMNMIAVSNPGVLDRTLAPEGYIVLHAYGAGNEPYDIWKAFSDDMIIGSSIDSSTDKPLNYEDGRRYQSSTYEALKDERAKPLWRAIESIIPDAKDRVVLALLGSPLTHERFLRRPFGTYGAAFEDCLKDGSTPIPNLILAGDGVFPGIGIPAVALSGSSAANGMVAVIDQWLCMDELKSRGVI